MTVVRHNLQSNQSSVINVTLELGSGPPPLDGTSLPVSPRVLPVSFLLHIHRRQLLPVCQMFRLHTHERPFTMHDLAAWCADGKFAEPLVQSAVIIAPCRKDWIEGKGLWCCPSTRVRTGPV